MEAHCVLGFIFSLTVLPVSNKINTSYIRLVSICSLGTVLWLTLAPAGHLCSLKGLQLKSTFVPPATFLNSPVLQVKTQ